ncbi:TRAP transporter substrate-binding protein [Thalassospira alkalitolerans]|uniref:C4-dicarboxylate ABC transporter substrate-binding protein n=1 Tax=Thalassospira alkalitolerans TaxID=1293890 RepID=A0A1Y2LFN1_9PROT|nr:TRAP transporter substrate-binding protein [Thalassospira alkalitolerans]OSQ49544.1 C4-dicarboxylate ABC transporter substrate-binding protein [Thalassospira alkalitolerans]|tara:strand:- start:115428 stop:116402 length:975 start_codon:yes stop_codon:yes gene_type:complete
MLKKALSTVAVAAMTMSAGIAMAAEKWDMATPYPDATFHTQNIIEFAKDVKEATGGELEITVHSGGSLFKHADIKRSVQRGLVPAGETLISLLANEDPVYGVDAIPFLATSYDEAKKLWAASRSAVEEKLAGDGLKVLYAVAWPAQGLYTAKPVNSVEDLNGLSFRAYNAATSKLADLTGMVATQVEVPEIPTAFATGIVEAMMTSSSTGANSKAWDFVQNFYDVQAWLPKNMVIVNAKAFDSLSPDVQKAVMDAAAKAETRGWDMSMAETDAKKKILVDNGMNVAAPSAELKSGLAKVGEQMVADWLSEAGDEGQAIIDAFKK